MNPYELADELDTMLKAVGLSDNRVPTMLRQQADRIAELEDKLSFYEIKDLDSGLKPKPLSDEEIKEVWLKRPANTAEDVVRFARAIEERHGIK